MTDLTQLGKIAEFIGQYFVVFNYGLTKKGSWQILIQGLGDDPLQIIIEPFDISDRYALEYTMDIIAKEVAAQKKGGLIL
jgi:hypothetical protein